jgi:general secretion pathway protein G
MNNKTPKMDFGKQKAFTLIELMIVLSIIGILSALALPSYMDYIDKVEGNQAVQDIARIGKALDSYYFDNGSYPDSLAELGMDDWLDPWGNPYQYLNIANTKGKGKLRKDRNLVPINSDFDLYSMGPDGRSVGPLTAKHSRDDIIRAGNGSFIGVAEDY